MNQIHIIIVPFSYIVFQFAHFNFTFSTHRDWSIHAGTLFYQMGYKDIKSRVAAHVISGHEVAMVILETSSLRNYLHHVYSKTEPDGILLGANWGLSQYDAHHVISFRPQNISLYLKILNMVAESSFEQRYRIWHPPTVFHWPFPLFSSAIYHINPTDFTNDFECPSLSNQKFNGSHWKHFIRHCILQETLVPLARKAFDVNQNIYFMFEINSDSGSKILHSYWEVYFISGYESTKTVVQEVYGDEMRQLLNYRILRRSNFRNVKLTAVAPNYDNTRYQLKWEKVSGTSQLVGGISWDMLKDFEFSMNFQSEIIQGDWITQHDNGTLNGTTTDLLTSRRVDLMIGQTVPIGKRAGIMEFLQPTSENTLRAYVHQPPASAFHNIFVSPFELSLRLAMSLFVVLVIFSIHFTFWILSVNGYRFKSEDKQFTKESWIWLIATITQRGCNKHPDAVSLRCIFITGVLTALVCYVAYAAEITSTLSVETIPIQSLADLFKSSLPIYVGESSITLQEYVKGFKKQFHVKFINVSLCMGVTLILKAPSSFLMYTHRFHHERKIRGIPDYVACNLYAFPLTGAPLPSAMGVPKQSPLKEYFNYRIIAMKEHGLLDRYKKKMNFVSGLHCASEINTSSRSHLGLSDVFSTLIILFSGYLFCLGFIVCERIYFYKWVIMKRRKHLQYPWID